MVTSLNYFSVCSCIKCLVQIFKFCTTVMQEINLCVHETFSNDNRHSLKLLEQTTHQLIVNMWSMAFVEITIIVLSKRSLHISYVAIS